MRRKFALFIIALAIFSFTSPILARENSGEFGFGLYNLGYYFPMLSEKVEFNDGDYEIETNFEGESDFIHNVQFTYGITSRVFFQLSAAYYQGSMEIEREYYRSSAERREWVTLYGENDFKVMPISLGIGVSFLKEGKFDPYCGLGMTFFRVKVDTVDLGVEDVIVRDNATNQRIQSAERVLERDFIGYSVDRDYATELGYYLDLGMNYFFLDNFAVNADVRYYGGTIGLYELDDVDFDIGGFAVTCGFKFVF